MVIISPFSLSFLLLVRWVLLIVVIIQNVGAFTHHRSHPSITTTITTTQLNARPQTIYRHVQNNILTRRTINDFQKSLPTDWERSLENAIEAAIYAPNHKRTEPWRFYLLGPKAIEKVCKLNAELVSSAKGEAAGKKKLDRWLGLGCGWLVVTCVKQSGEADDGNSMEDPMGLAREDYAACCCAVQNLCLSLQSQGLGTKWTTGEIAIYTLCGIDIRYTFLTFIIVYNMRYKGL